MSEVYSRSYPRKRQRKIDRMVETRDGTVYTQPGTLTTTSWTDSVNGEKNPRWRDQVRMGHNACTPFVGQRTVIVPTDFYIQAYPNRITGSSPTDYVYGENDGQYYPTPSSYASVTSLSESLANASALAQYVRNIRRLQTTLNGAVCLGEMARVVGMIRNPAKLLSGGLHRYLDNVKNRYLRYKRKPRYVSDASRARAQAELLRVTSETWLEASFGWLPLLNDIDDGIRAAAESGVLERDFRRPVQGFGVEESRISETPTQLGSSWPQINGATLTTSKVVVVYRGMVDTGSYSAWDARRVGFAPTNWLPTLWELLPYSFLIDYFTNIGNIISAYSLARTGLMWTNKTTVKSIKKAYIGTYVPFNGFISSSAYTSYYLLRLKHGNVDVRTVQRAPYTGSLVPDLTFSTPGSGLRWLNLTALFGKSRDLQSKIGSFISKLF